MFTARAWSSSTHQSRSGKCEWMARPCSAIHPAPSAWLGKLNTSTAEHLTPSETGRSRRSIPCQTEPRQRSVQVASISLPESCLGAQRQNRTAHCPHHSSSGVKSPAHVCGGISTPRKSPAISQGPGFVRPNYKSRVGPWLVLRIVLWRNVPFSEDAHRLEWTLLQVSIHVKIQTTGHKHAYAHEQKGAGLCAEIKKGKCSNELHHPSPAVPPI